MRPGYTNHLTLIKRDLGRYGNDSNWVSTIATDISVISKCYMLIFQLVTKESFTVRYRRVDWWVDEFTSEKCINRVNPNCVDLFN